MSYEAYAHHILQKHRLAVSLAVIKSKPENKTLEEHIQHLNMITDAKTDVDVDNLSICSDDFSIGETNDFNMNFNQNNDWDDNLTQINDATDDCDVNDVDFINTQDVNINLEDYNRRTTIIDPQNEMKEPNEMIDTQNLKDSITILENIDISRLDDVTDILRGIDDNMANIEKAPSNEITTKLTEKIFLTQPSQVIDLAQCFIDIDATQCNSLDISATVNDYALSQKYYYNFSNDSVASKNEEEAKKNTKLEPNIESTEVNNTQINNTKCQRSTINIKTKIQHESKENGLDQENRSKNAASTTCKLKEYRPTKELKNVNKNVASIFNNKNNNLSKEEPKSTNTTKALDKSRDIAKHSQEVVIQNLTQDLTCKTHYSESQIENIITIEDKHIYGNKRNIQPQDKQDVNKKKKKKSVVSVEGKIIKKSKKQTNNIKNISTGNDITLPKIQLTQSKTVKENVSQKVIEISQKTQNINETALNEANTQIMACDAVIIDSQKTTCSTSSYNDQIFEQNSQDTSVLIRKKTTISNAVQPKNNIINAIDTRLYTIDNDVPYNKDSTLHSLDKTLNDENTITSNKTTVTPVNNTLFNNNSSIIVNNVSIANDLNKLPDLNANNSNQNINKALLDLDLFTQESELFHSNDTFENNILNNCNGYSRNIPNDKDRMLNDNNDTVYNKDSMLYAGSRMPNVDDSMFQDDNETLAMNYNSLYTQNIFNNGNKSDEVTSKRCTDYDPNFDITLTGQSRFINLDNSQNIEANAKNTENIDITENLKICANFDNAKCMTVTEYRNRIEHKNVTEGCANIDDNFDEITDSQVEKIPFKIIEELNKIKVFLNKRNDINLSARGCSNDTGYRSDGSSRNTLKLSQTLTGVVDQSAHSLFNYISGCPLVAATQDITEDISLILGQLIDKLHEEEKYPSFLEDLLQLIQNLLGMVSQQDYHEDMLTKKDESIHRIILLNKSMHVQKYTIEKITNILENLHTDICSNESYEIKNVDIIENMCYIFNLLESILNAYNRSSQNLNLTQNLTPNTQNLSQNTQEDEKLLKKSNIMDIWRKKWNPNYKETPIEGSQEKVCAITNCNAVLNKLIVGCMEGYSLISYYALKCFNVIQS